MLLGYDDEIVVQQVIINGKSLERKKHEKTIVFSIFYYHNCVFEIIFIVVLFCQTMQFFFSLVVTCIGLLFLCSL